MAAFMAKKKAEDMRAQLKTIIIMSRGMGAWEELLKTRIQHGVDNGLTEEFMNKVLKAIHQESINRQTKVMNK